VFNFYRPGFIAPGTASGSLGMTVPELQIVNASSTPGYVNFMSFFIFGAPRGFESEGFLREFFAGTRYLDDLENRARNAFVADYFTELDLAGDAGELVNHVDRLLAHGELGTATKDAMVALISDIEVPDDPDEDDYESRYLRVHLAVTMAMTAPEYLVQR
jgi:hypothetical protein